MENSIVIIGAGRIGSKIAEKILKFYKNILIIDRDIVEESNVEDGYIFTLGDLGKPKALVLKKKLNINGIVEDLSSDNMNLIKDAKLIIDGTDNFETRFLLNDFAVKNSIPYIFSSVIQNKGMVFPIMVNKPCLRCVFEDPLNFQSCETLGVELNVVEKVTDKQLELGLKILNKGEVLSELIYFNNKEKNIMVKNRLNCKCCIRRNYEFLNSKSKTRIVKFCGSGCYMIKDEFDFLKLKNKLKNKIEDYGNAFNYKGIMVYRDKVMLKAENKIKAKNLYLELINEENG